jgi:hypothetical protein
MSDASEGSEDAAALGVEVLAAYERVCARIRGRLYMPVRLVREELRKGMHQRLGTTRAPTKTQVDAVLRHVPELLPDHIVSFSPFSGPARGGLTLGGDSPWAARYAGFISIRPR